MFLKGTVFGVWQPKPFSRQWITFFSPWVFFSFSKWSILFYFFFLYTEFFSKKDDKSVQFFLFCLPNKFAIINFACLYNAHSAPINYDKVRFLANIHPKPIRYLLHIKISIFKILVYYILNPKKIIITLLVCHKNIFLIIFRGFSFIVAFPNT